MAQQLVRARPTAVEYDPRAEEIVVICSIEGDAIEPEEKTWRFPAPTTVERIYEEIVRHLRDVSRELAPQLTVEQIKADVGRGLVLTVSGERQVAAPPA